MENILISSKISKKAKRIVLGISLLCVFLTLIFLIFVLDDSIYKSDYGYYFSRFGYPYIYLFFSFTFVSLIFLIYFWMICKMQIIVTDKRVYGKTYFGRSVDLPIDSISAVGSSMFNGIAVATSSGKIKFLCIENSKVVHEEVIKLLMNRQKQQKNVNTPATPVSYVDELKKYKELLDSGVITEDEFNQKKKQLLGL